MRREASSADEKALCDAAINGDAKNVAALVDKGVFIDPYVRTFSLFLFRFSPPLCSLLSSLIFNFILSAVRKLSPSPSREIFLMQTFLSEPFFLFSILTIFQHVSVAVAHLSYWDSFLFHSLSCWHFFIGPAADLISLECAFGFPEFEESSGRKERQRKRMLVNIFLFLAIPSSRQCVCSISLLGHFLCLIFFFRCRHLCSGPFATATPTAWTSS